MGNEKLFLKLFGIATEESAENNHPIHVSMLSLPGKVTKGTIPPISLNLQKFSCVLSLDVTKTKEYVTKHGTTSTPLLLPLHLKMRVVRKRKRLLHKRIINTTIKH